VDRPNEGAQFVREPENSTPRANRWAWGLCWLMFASTVLNYMDRQTIAQVSGQIRATFGLASYEEFGWVVSAFIVTYALFQVPAGYLVDRWDLRWSYAAAVAWWSMAAVATAVVPSLGWLIVCRALLGVGESFNWPCALRVTARVLPPADRGLGNGIFNSGAAVGAVVTPLVVAYLTPRYGWRTTFAVIGLAGFVWVVAWLILVQGEQRHLLAKPDRGEDPSADGRQPLAGTARAAFGGVFAAALAVALSAFWYGPSAIWLGVAIAMLGPLLISWLLRAQHLPATGWAASLSEVVRHRRFWILVVVSITINVCWHFLINWIPTYLKDERGLNDQNGNYLSAVTFLAADAGNLAGGWLSRRLAAHGLNVVRARQVVMSVCVLMILAGLGLYFRQSDISAMVLVSIMAAGTAAFMANYFAFTQDVSSRNTGLIVGYLGGLGNLFVAGSQPIFGRIKDSTGSFTLNFLIVAVAPVVGLACLLWGWNDREPMTNDY
jgi:MFS transporter, ACS family, hexuronate transporter